jgi:hypothetical protein
VLELETRGACLRGIVRCERALQADHGGYDLWR